MESAKLLLIKEAKRRGYYRIYTVYGSLLWFGFSIQMLNEFRQMNLLYVSYHQSYCQCQSSKPSIPFRSLADDAKSRARICEPFATIFGKVRNSTWAKPKIDPLSFFYFLVSQNFVEQLQEKMDKIEAETSGFVVSLFIHYLKW